jgi:TonB-linked SusC/RagA family outer membrane protein
MTGREFATYVNDIEPGTFNNLDVLPNVNWQDRIFQENAPIQSYTVSLGSATDKIDYYFSLGYFNQQGVIDKSGFERITTKVNTTYKITEDFELGLNLSVAFKEKQNAPGVINSALRSWPIEEPFNPDGSFAEVQGAGNPLASIEFTNSETNSVESVGNLYAAYSFLDGFTIKSSFQFSAGLNKTKSFTPQFFVAPLQQNETSDISQSYSDNTFLLWENTIAYDKEIGIHRINAVAGYTAQEVRSEFLSGSAQNLLREDESFWYINASDGDPLLQNVSNSGGRSAITSILFRANYSLLDKYLFTVTGRRDGSSKFGANNRYGFFPSVAVGWNIADEDFFPKVAFISGLKFRGSWGIVGNDKIPSIAQFSLISSGINGVFGQNDRLVAGATFDGGGNPDLKWEETEQINFGLNMDFFESRLVTEVDYYVKTTNDILVPLEPVGYSGIGAFRSIFYNVATVENKGFEFNVNWRDQIGDFNYSLGFLGSTLQNEVLNLGENIGADSIITAGNLGNGQQISRTVVGRPIGFFLGYKVAGVIQNQGDLDNLPTLPGQGIGDFLYEDTNGDGVLNADDRVQIGNSIPSFIYGFNAQVGWKNFTVSADFQGQMGSDIYNGKQAIRFALLNYEDKFNNRWTGEGSTNEHPRASQGGVNFTPSDYFVESGDYLRLRTLTINYDIPVEILNKIKIQAARVYVRGTNLFTITDFTGFSPDIGASNALDGVIDQGVYPITRIYSLGLNMTF